MTDFTDITGSIILIYSISAFINDSNDKTEKAIKNINSKRVTLSQLELQNLKNGKHSVKVPCKSLFIIFHLWQAKKILERGSLFRKYIKFFIIFASVLYILASAFSELIQFYAHIGSLLKLVVHIVAITAFALGMYLSKLAKRFL